MGLPMVSLYNLYKLKYADPKEGYANWIHSVCR